ncbi:Down syndrome cell adhesion molecule homolog [Eumeta japonica]|uniref:Down syndrome cell adhesion molecule homolog n=1 Tax=Eumeta variegata TaxID=151549 RepID=A0A4C1Y4U6_EUMVA|nr:Down syndrome cell adhesion molecule homolog [Eumeta japonica]
MQKEIERRIANTWKRFWSLSEIMKNKEMSMSAKRKVYNACILPCLTYACQTWALTKQQQSKINICQNGIERRSGGARRKRDIAIMQHFVDRPVTPGDDISLQCTATGDRPPRFVWERDGVVIDSNTDQRSYLPRQGAPIDILHQRKSFSYQVHLGQMMSDSGVGVLTQLNITRVRVEDGGLYSCIAIEGETTASHTARLDVYGPPYIRTLPSIKVQSGDSLKLRCPYYGFPVSKLEWEHKGQKILTANMQPLGRYKRSYKRKVSVKDFLKNMKRKRRKRQLYGTDESEVLSIPKLTKAQNGDTYVCIVYSPTGEMSRRPFEIQVVEAPELDELHVGSGLKAGQIVQIMCNIISGDPPIYFSWLKDGKKIPPGLKVTERSSELFSILIIKKVSLEHCGKYTCIATNHIGKVNQTAELYINVAPKWMEEPVNTSLLLGQRGLVYCNANGYPSPQIHWMKKDETLGIWRPILDLAGGGIVSFSNGTLIIEVVSLNDEGMYSCNVENGVGDGLNKNIWISVNKPVHFETSGTNITTKVGLSVEMVCQPLGDSPIRIKWTQDGKPVDFTSSSAARGRPIIVEWERDARHSAGLSLVRVTKTESVAENGVKSILNVDYVDTRDGGTYQCRASNPYGVAVHAVYLSVLEPPSAPVELQTESVSSRSVKVSWRDSVKTHVQYYSVQYALNDLISWDMATTINVTRQNSEGRHTLEINDLRPATQYKLRVSAGNQVNLSPLHAAAPTSTPLSVQVQQTENPGELFVSWSPPPKNSHNGVLQGYHVRVTAHSAPEHAPSSVECIAMSSTSLRISWQPIPGHGNGLIGYTILYSLDDSPWYNMTSPQTELYLQGLTKYANYTIKIAGFSNYGPGPYSYPVTCTTLQDVPGPPAAIKVLVSSSTSLLVTWKRPESPNGEITHYTVYIKPSLSTMASEAHRVESPQDVGLLIRHMSLEVKHLTENRPYDISASAHTAAGEGPATPVVTREPTSRVVAGVASLGGVSVGVGNSLLLICECVGAPPPRIVWYHNQNIITHHPRFTRNHDDSLLINNIDQSLSGNYTCLAKNLFGSDSVSYSVNVLPTPEPPLLRATPYKDSILVEWDQQGGFNRSRSKMNYNLTWKESEGLWHEALLNDHSAHRHTLTGLKCGTKYSLRITVTNAVGTSQPSYLDVTTLGGVPIPPNNAEWFWSNSTHIYVQLSGWDDNGCDMVHWDVEYRPYGGKVWLKAGDTLFSAHSIYIQPNYFVISNLESAQWYHIKVTATNEAGSVTSFYNYATRTESGAVKSTRMPGRQTASRCRAVMPPHYAVALDSFVRVYTIGPPSEQFDLNMLVIVCSSALLIICLLTCVYILIKKYNNQQRLAEYRNSLTVDCKSESGNLTVGCQNLPAVKDNPHCTRVYSTPHTRQ